MSREAASANHCPGLNLVIIRVGFEYNIQIPIQVAGTCTKCYATFVRKRGLLNSFLGVTLVLWQSVRLCQRCIFIWDGEEESYLVLCPKYPGDDFN